MKMQARVAAGIGAAAALGVLLTACGSAAPASSPATSTPTAATTSAPTSGAQVAGAALQFPNKDLTVLIDGYDAANRMVEFHLAVWQPGQVDDGTYNTDPHNTAAHRLAIAPDATLTSFSPDCTAKGGTATQGTHCTLAQYIQSLGDDSGAGPAKLHVNAADQIQTVQALYHP